MRVGREKVSPKNCEHPDPGDSEPFREESSSAFPMVSRRFEGYVKIDAGSIHMTDH